jgi:hypothetical protein
VAFSTITHPPPFTKDHLLFKTEDSQPQLNKKESQPLSVSIFRKCFNHEIWKNKLTCEFSTFFKELFLLDSISSSK